MSRKRWVTFLKVVILGIIGTCVYIKLSSAIEPPRVLLMNEICGHNDTLIHNGIGYYNDYVEFYNYSEEAINLSDYFLSDDEEYLRKCKLPNIKLESQEYYVFFVDDYSAGFGIGDNECIYLANSEGNIVDCIELSSTKEDMVYARNVDTLQWEYGYLASPGEANVIKERPKLIEDENSTPVLSAESGFYEEPFYLEIITDYKYNIYYTLDGSTPTEESYLYEEPILIADVSNNENVYSLISNISTNQSSVQLPEYLVDKCNVIRAIAVAADGAISKEVYGTYFVGFEDKYGYDKTYTLSLITDPENLFSHEKGIYVPGAVADKGVYVDSESGDAHELLANYSQEGKGWRRFAYVELFDEKGQYLGDHSVKIGIHGNYSAMQPQKSFNLLADSASGDERYLFSGVLGNERTSLMIRAGGTVDWRETQFRDVLCNLLVEERELTILHGIPCQVFLDGEYWGLYTLQERIDQGIIAENFGVEEDNVIVIKNDTVVGKKDSYYELYQAVVDYAGENDLSIDEHYVQIGNMIDIQSYIDYYCFILYIAACDTVSNNYACWRTENTSSQEYCDGKWRWIVYDVDDSTGLRDGLTNAEVDSFLYGHMKNSPMQDVLFTSLMQNESFKYQFVSTFVKMADTIFSPEYVNALIDELCGQYMEASVISHARYNHEDFTEDDYLEKVEVIRDFFERRRPYIMEHLENNLGIEDVKEYLSAGE